MDDRLRWAGVHNDGWENDGSAHKQAYAPLLTYTHIRTALRDLAVMLLSSDLQRYNRLKQITKQLGIIGLYVACSAVHSQLIRKFYDPMGRWDSIISLIHGLLYVCKYIGLMANPPVLIRSLYISENSMYKNKTRLDSASSWGHQLGPILTDEEPFMLLIKCSSVEPTAKIRTKLG